MVIPSTTMKNMNRSGSSSSSSGGSGVDLLPDDIMVAILILVPPRSLLRLKLVCRSWRSLIAHPDFIQLHLQHSITNNKPPPSILISILISDVNYETKRHVLHSLNYYNDDDGVRLDPIPHSTTVRLRGYCGSCNGLLYLVSEEHFGLCIWNPCTLEYLRVPHIQIDGQFEAHLIPASFGFGYDATTDNYKLIRIKSFYLDNPNADANANESRQFIETQVQVYTLGSKTWEAIGTVPFEVSLKNDLAGLFLNGGLHWIAIEAVSGRGMIICIDIASEEYREISKPGSVSINRDDLVCVNSNVKLNVLKGLFCITNFVIDDEKPSIEVWVMKDYYDNEPSSWSKLFTIKEPLLALPYPELRYFELLSDICNKDGDEIVALMTIDKRSKSLVWYNVKNDKTRTIVENTYEDVCQFVQVQTCIESLVSLNTGYYNFYSLEETIKEEKEKEERQRLLRPRKKQKKNIYMKLS